MKAEVSYGVSFLEYGAIPAINWHRLEPMRKSPRHCRHEELAPAEAGPAMVRGEALHAAILEPARFAEEYASEPKFEGHPNSNAYKAQRDEWRAAHTESVLLTASEYNEVRAMAAATAEHPVAAALLAAKGRNELSVCWTDAEHGCKLKSRIDRVCRVPARLIYPTAPDRGEDVICLLDVKTTRAIVPHDFERELVRFGYHGQLAMYADALSAADPAEFCVAILAVENQAPFDVAVYRMDAEIIEHGRRLYRRLLARYLDCQRSGLWPGVAPTATGIDLPAWGREGEAVVAKEEVEDVE